MINFRNIWLIIMTITSVIFIDCSGGYYAPEEIASENIDDELMELAIEEEVFADSIQNMNVIEDLEVYETMAIQQLHDFIDYVSIIGNTEYDKAFRKEALKQTQKMFISKNIEIRSLLQDSTVLGLGRFLKKVLNNKESLKFDEVEIITTSRFEENNQESYNCKATINYKIDTISHTRECVVWLVIVEKDFGGESLEVWDIMLGQIE